MLRQVNLDNRIDHSYGPSTIFIQEKKVPIPYFLPAPTQASNCNVGSDSHSYRHMMPFHFFLPFTLLGAFLLFSLLTLGLLLLVDRSRLTSVVTARIQDPNYIESLEKMVLKGIEIYDQLNKG